MSVLILAFLGGLLTILSPCILPVLPFVFARLGQPFRSSVLPMLVGMAVSFATVGSLAAISGSWVVQANQTGRLLALVLLAVFGLGLLFPALADRLSQPLVRLGNRLSLRADRARLAGDAVGGSLLLGVAIGLLWAPCAGPILGLILTGAAMVAPVATQPCCYWPMAWGPPPPWLSPWGPAGGWPRGSNARWGPAKSYGGALGPWCCWRWRPSP